MTTLSLANQQTLVRLRRRWTTTAVLWLTVWLLGYSQLRLVWPFANRWLLLSGLTLAYGLWVLWRGLASNARAGEEKLLPNFGPGNQMTLLRGLCLALLAGFLFAPWPQGRLAWLLVLLYTIVDIADYLDGFLARRANHATGLGATLDMEFDGLGMLIVTLLAVSFGQLPIWYLGLGLARYLFIFGLWWRKRNNRPIHDLSPSVHRRLFAGFQMGFMSATLWPILPASMATIAGTLFAIPTALGFLRDWLVASGRLDPTSATYRQVQRLLYRATTRWLPLLLRPLLLVCMLLIYATIPTLWQPEPWLTLLQSWGVPIAAGLAMLLGIVGVLGTALIVNGISGRFAAMALAFPIGFDIASQGLGWASGLALGCIVCLMLLGTGPWSLWQPEEGFMLRHVGGD